MYFPIVAVILLLLCPPFPGAHAEDPSTKPGYKIAIGIDDGEKTALYVPSETDFCVIKSLVDGIQQTPGLEKRPVLIQLVSDARFESEDEMVIFLYMSNRSTRVAASDDILPYDMLPGLVEAIADIGYSRNVILVNSETLVTRDGSRWAWDNASTDHDRNGG